ncbi:RluA family pseudouridine synthase [Methylophaga lonarensis]|uniref:RluA family pseudouridine synthase n=1 Tax=Methylophaga lonarensis TaxID=999151 RepID=UPI003D28713B
MSVKPSPIDCHVAVSAQGVTALELLATESGVSRQKIKDAMSKGAVWLTRGKKTQRLRRAKFMPLPGDRLRLCFDAHLLASSPPEPRLLADQRMYTVWYKPPMLLSQGTIWGDHCSLLRLAEQHFEQKRKVFLVHRLDREAHGLMLIAHQAQASAQLSALFQDHRMQKHYEVRIVGNFAEHAAENSITVNQPLDGKHAVSHLQLLDYDAERNESLLSVTIETGRKHQIRKHCALLDLPVVGDTRYGSADKRGMQLKACRLVFNCPVTKQTVEYICPPSTGSALDI